MTLEFDRKVFDGYREKIRRRDYDLFVTDVSDNYLIDSLTTNLYALAEQRNITKKDMPYFALALSSGCSIWSNEKMFKEQSEADIFSTDGIKKLFDIE